MQKLVGLVRRCVEDYKMIEPGDRIAVGVSGGKDSVALLVFLAELRKYNHNPFEVEAITIDMGLGMDFSGIEQLCRELDVPYIQNGSLVLAFDEADDKTVEKLYHRGVENGVPGLEIISGDEARKREPNLSKQVTSALWAPSAGTFTLRSILGVTIWQWM